MKQSLQIFVIYIFLQNIFAGKAFSQSFEDSVMIANCEKWNIAYKNGMLTLSNPGSAQVFTMNLSKLDSGKIKQKRKDSSYVEFSGSGGLDGSKYMTIKKSRVYKLQMGTDENSTAALFVVTNESNEKRQTFLGKMISKNHEEENEVLSSESTVYGTIKRNNLATGWEFSLKNLSANSGLPFSFFSAPEGFLTSEKDSLYLERASFKADAVLVDVEGHHVGAVKFRKKPFTIWVQKNMENSLQDAVAVLFGVMIAKKSF
ncbi:MAG: hypothetical protein ACTHJT_13045 [Cytophaga sp.]|uniref:hypothetical protein n=1 Tax=Cytophaga sp. TaxID=29535 RepID=UPI003F800DF9